MAEQRDLYEVLGLQKGASDDEIKKAYRKLAKKYQIHATILHISQNITTLNSMGLFFWMIISEN